MSISEKLGIKPIEYDYVPEIGCVYATEEVEELEQQNADMLEGLIEAQEDIERLTEYINKDLFECMPDSLILPIAKRMQKRVNITERRTGKTWQEIKQLIS